MKRIETEIENVNISQLTPKLFNVRSRCQFYQVWLGSDTQLPSCQCIDYRTKKLPCKHICAVAQQLDVGWESLGSRFDTHPLFTLDKEVTQSSRTEDSKPSSEVDDSTSFSSTSKNTVNITSVEERYLEKSEPVTVGLPCRKKSNIRRQCIQEVKSLHDELYIINDKDALNETLKKIRDVLSYARKHRPKENGIALKDKSLSPKKVAVKRLASTCKLARRKKKNYFQKRVGSVADGWKAKVNVEDEENRKRKGSKLQDSNLADRKKRKELEEVDEDGHRASDIWIMINGVKLTYALRAILITRFGWLTDDHIDAAQHLIKELNTGVGGLNCIAATTHCSRFALPHDPHQTIQCHNIVYIG